jgi:hypothetical protein
MKSESRCTSRWKNCYERKEDRKSRCGESATAGRSDVKQRSSKSRYCNDFRKDRKCWVLQACGNDFPMLYNDSKARLSQYVHSFRGYYFMAACKLSNTCTMLVTTIVAPTVEYLPRVQFLPRRYLVRFHFHWRSLKLR